VVEVTPEVAQNAVKLGLNDHAEHGCGLPAGRCTPVAMVVEHVVVGAALHGTAFLRDVIRLPGGEPGEAKGRRHQGAPAPLAALALVVEEVGVHAYDADPLQRPQALELVFGRPLISSPADPHVVASAWRIDTFCINSVREVLN